MIIPFFGFADECPANPGARIFKGAAGEAPAPWGEDPMATVPRWFILRAFCLPLANVLFGLQFEEVQCLHFLFYLDGIPAFFQTEFAFLLLSLIHISEPTRLGM